MSFVNRCACKLVQDLGTVPAQIYFLLQLSHTANI